MSGFVSTAATWKIYFVPQLFLFPRLMQLVSDSTCWYLLFSNGISYHWRNGTCANTFTSHMRDNYSATLCILRQLLRDGELHHARSYVRRIRSCVHFVPTGSSSVQTSLQKWQILPSRDVRLISQCRRLSLAGRVTVALRAKRLYQCRQGLAREKMASPFLLCFHPLECSPPLC